MAAEAVIALRPNPVSGDRIQAPFASASILQLRSPQDALNRANDAAWFSLRLNGENAMEDKKTDRIRARAHEIWVSEGKPDGMHERHWDLSLIHI